MMTSGDNDALERARRLLNKKPPEAGMRRSASKPNAFRDTLDTAKEFNDNVNWLRRFIGRMHRIWLKVLAGLSVIWAYSGPVRFIIGPVARFIGRNYLHFFRWFAYKRMEDSETAILSKKRASLMIFFTALIPVGLWYGTKPALITLQQIVMAAVAEKEVYTYFHGAETVEEGRLYSIKTTRRVPATPDSTMHMHVQSDLIYWIWYPEDLANAVPNEVAWGRVKYTGWRWKPLGWFPEVKDVEAIPLSELPDDHPAKSGDYYLSNEQVEEAVRTGAVLPGTDF